MRSAKSTSALAPAAGAAWWSGVVQRDRRVVGGLLGGEITTWNWGGRCRRGGEMTSGARLSGHDPGGGLQMTCTSDTLAPGSVEQRIPCSIRASAIGPCSAYDVMVDEARLPIRLAPTAVYVAGPDR